MSWNIERSHELLEAVAEDLENLVDPFSHERLVEHKITASELRILAPYVANIIRGYLRTDDQTRRHLAALGLGGVDR